MIKRRFWKLFLGCIIAVCCIFLYEHLFNKRPLEGHKVVVCIPVYGQSLALGEEAQRITDFNQLRNDNNGRILTENLDYEFGCFDNNQQKQIIKKLFHYHKRSFELSVYGMAETLVKQLGSDTVICIFPGGQGGAILSQLVKPQEPYKRLLADIQKAYEKAKEYGWDLYVPAICWMQGESDITDYPQTDYNKLLKQFCKDINKDVKAITHQIDPVRLIAYQPNAVTRAKNFYTNKYDCIEMRVPQTLLALIRDDSLFVASGPTYPYTFVREAIHIDGFSQKQLGRLEALAAIRIIRNQTPFLGLIPDSATFEGNNIFVYLNIPAPPLVKDTINVKKINNYGFNVINDKGEDIISNIILGENYVEIECNQSPSGSKVRYAVNGEPMKSGNQSGPRGNLRDSDENWCYQFELILE